MAQLRKILAPSADILLLTTEDAEAHATSCQIYGVAAEIEALYSANFDVDLTYVESAFEADPQTPTQATERLEYKAYKISAKARYRGFPLNKRVAKWSLIDVYRQA